jgi:hypothetical protein
MMTLLFCVKGKRDSGSWKEKPWNSNGMMIKILKENQTMNDLRNTNERKERQYHKNTVRLAERGSNVL